MPKIAEIKYITKVPRVDIYKAIRQVGGASQGGGVWKWDLDKAIKAITSGEYSFFVGAAGRRTNVIVARGVAGNLYLKTEADTTTVNNLLSLPEFP
jgi:hypothetical protein